MLLLLLLLLLRLRLLLRLGLLHRLLVRRGCPHEPAQLGGSPAYSYPSPQGERAPRGSRRDP